MGHRKGIGRGGGGVDDACVWGGLWAGQGGGEGGWGTPGDGLSSSLNMVCSAHLPKAMSASTQYISLLCLPDVHAQRCLSSYTPNPLPRLFLLHRSAATQPPWARR